MPVRHDPRFLMRGLLGLVRGCWLFKRLICICLNYTWKCLRPAIVPKSLGNRQWIDTQIIPPVDFLASLMELPMMDTAERNGELVADLEPQRPGLGKAQVMGIGWRAAAQKAWLRCDKSQMLSVAMASGVTKRQHASVNICL